MCQLTILEHYIAPMDRAGFYKKAIGIALDCLPARRASVFWHKWHFICWRGQQAFHEYIMAYSYCTMRGLSATQQKRPDGEPSDLVARLGKGGARLDY